MSLVIENFEPMNISQNNLLAEGNYKGTINRISPTDRGAKINILIHSPEKYNGFIYTFQIGWKGDCSEGQILAGRRNITGIVQAINGVNFTFPKHFDLTKEIYGKTVGFNLFKNGDYLNVGAFFPADMHIEEKPAEEPKQEVKPVAEKSMDAESVRPAFDDDIPF